jgi:hypothetical protein
LPSYPFPIFADIENSFWIIFLSAEQRDLVKRLDSEKQKQLFVRAVVSDLMSNTVPDAAPSA